MIDQPAAVVHHVSQQDARVLVPEIFAAMTDYRICSGPLEDLWTDPVSGRRFKMQWRRSIFFKYFQRQTWGFQVFLSYKGQVRVLRYAENGQWTEASPLVDYDFNSDVYFHWNAVLNRYVGWSEEGPLGSAYPHPILFRFNGVTLSQDGLRLQYTERLPSQTPPEMQGTVSVFDEVLTIREGRLASEWRFGLWSFDPYLLRPLDILSQPPEVRRASMEQCAELVQK